MVVVQDVRGRHASGGVWNPYVSEADDGAQTVEWAARLPGADGRVCMYGSSYQGATALAAGSRRPPSLRAIAPMLCWGDPANGQTFRGGALEIGKLVRWTLMNMGDRLARRITDPAEADKMIAQCAADLAVLDAPDYRALPLSRQPLIDRYDPASEFFDYIANAERGDFGHPRLIADDQWPSVPALWIAGWFDAFLGDMIGMWERHQATGQTSQLVIGPWTHANQTQLVGELDNGDTAANVGPRQTGIHDLLTGWFRHILDGSPTPVPAPVTSFAMGGTEWVESETIPPAGVEPLTLYADNGGTLSATPSDEVASISYCYDPENPAPTVGGATLMGGAFPAGPRNQSALFMRDDVLGLATPPLSTAVRAAGWVQATLWVESDAPLTDFVVRLTDIAPDGSMLGVTDGIVRSRYEPGAPSRIEVDMWATDYRFGAGHRIGIQITSSSFPRWQRALNVDEPLGQVTQGREARQTLYFGGATPSSVRIGKR